VELGKLWELLAEQPRTKSWKSFDQTLKLTRNNPCISVDGCPLQCARKNIEASKGKLAASFMVTNVLRENRGLKPEAVTELGPKGSKLASILAEKIATQIDEINKNDR
jgi:uncharacterized metal-binding protein